MIALWSFGVPSLYAVLVFQRRAQVAALFDMADGCHRHELPKEDLDRLVTEFRRAAAHVTRTFDSGDPQAGVGDISFLWASYRPHCYPWELFESSRRLFLEAVLAVVFPDSAHQTVVAFVVSVSSLVALSWIRPYNCLDCNRLSIYAYGFVCIVLFCGLLNVAGLDGSSARARGDLAAFLILCNLGAFCFFVHSARIGGARHFVSSRDGYGAAGCLFLLCAATVFSPLTLAYAGVRLGARRLGGDAAAAATTPERLLATPDVRADDDEYLGRIGEIERIVSRGDEGLAERQKRLDAKLDRLEATVGERFAELAAKLDAVAAAARRGEAGT
ncbi:hypothetical protein JL720_12101 [Aureococcus anophagefferens]|nr:hypothetical protein JL720_12101 [Aureococcus anophagefferens]